jgi:hypothetical protein
MHFMPQATASLRNHLPVLRTLPPSSVRPLVRNKRLPREFLFRQARVGGN